LRRAGTSHLLFEPIELLEKPAAITPRPTINLVLCGRRARKMAIVAAAHRLCRVLYALLRHGTELEPRRLGVEEGPLTHTITRQYRLTPKPAGRLVAA
jgi:hypothetical protein